MPPLQVTYQDSTLLSTELLCTMYIVHALTEAVNMDIAATGVIVQEVDPGKVDTEMTKHFATDPDKPALDV